MKLISLQVGKTYICSTFGEITLIQVKSIEQGKVARCVNYRQMLDDGITVDRENLASYTDGPGDIPNYFEVPDGSTMKEALGMYLNML